MAELSSFIAAMRLASRLVSEGIQHINIVMDSELVYKAILGITSRFDDKIASLVMMGKDLFHTNTATLPIRFARGLSRRQRGSETTVCS